MERRNDLDFAKGIGIILMVLGHCFSEGNGETIRAWFYSFHMPLFFIIPGMLFRSWQTLPSISVFLKKRVRGLMIPYYIWGVVAALYLTVMGRRPLEWLLGLLKNVLTLEGLSAMWFLPCLFLAELLFRCCMRAGQRYPLLGHSTAAALAVIGFAVPTPHAFAAVLLRSLTGASLIYLGWFLADLLNRPCKAYVWVVACIAQVCLALLNGQINVLDRVYGNFVLFYLNALLGTWVMIQLYQVLVQIRWHRLANPLVWFGRNSLIVVCTSLYAIDFIRLADYKLLGNLLPTLGDAEGLILCTLAMGFEAISIIICRKYLWWTFGKMSQFRN